MYGYDLRYNHIMGNHDITIGYRHHHDYRDRHDSGISETYTLGSNNTMSLNQHLIMLVMEMEMMILLPQSLFYYR